jgi:hypothetical protein
LRGADFVKEIREIQICVDNTSMFENAPLLKSLIESLEPMISILSDEMAQRIGRIVLVIVRDNSQRLVPFESKSYVDIGMRLAMGIL